jgi:dihydropteroate synthase
MIGRVIEIENISAAEKELLLIGSEALGIKLMAPKSVNRAIKLKGVNSTAANIVKQEMLSLGGEAAITHGAVDHSVGSTDMLIFGTLKQIDRLTDKLKIQQFGLPQIAEQIVSMLKNYSQAPQSLKIGGKEFDFRRRTYIMGILNVTPDSFSDGGKYLDTQAAIAQTQKMLAEGADIIDVGGESTRPGSIRVSAQEERKRVIPLIERLVKETDAIISIDTTKAEVARAALDAGASLVNDISGLRFDPEMARVVADFDVPLCIMHIQGRPKDMQANPVYLDLMGEIIDYLEKGLAIAKSAGILHEKIIIDPGIGFGKTVKHNLEILRRLKELKVLGCPVMVGTSRKSMIGTILDLPVEERVEGTAATVAISIAKGANIIRAHDVKEIARVAKMTDAIYKFSS